MADSIKLTKVPETLLKKRKRIDEVRARTIAGEVKTKKRVPGIKQIAFQRAEKYIKSYRVKERYEITLKRRSKKPESCKPQAPAEQRLVFALRIRGANSLHPQPRKVLKLLRLTKVNSGTFLALNKTTLALLQLAEPYVTWGYPSLQSVRELLYKRGQAKVNGKLHALTDNAMVEQVLGEFDIICLEDLIHEIITLGPHFKDVMTLLWHFKMNPPAGGWKKTSTSFSQGGDSGSREEKINYLLKRMI